MLPAIVDRWLSYYPPNYSKKNMTTKTKAAPVDKEQLITSQLIALLESGVKPWHKPWKGNYNGVKAQNLISGHEYSGANPLFCMISNLTYGYESPYYVTFPQAKALGWFPKKGAKSTWIRFAGSGTKEVENEQGEATEQRFNFAKWSNVFSTDCIDDSAGEKKIADLIIESIDPRPDNPDQKIISIEEFIASTGAVIAHGGNRACYSPSRDEIQLPEFSQFEDAEKYYATALHELTHWTGHQNRLDREGIRTGAFGDTTYAFEELIAEIGCAIVGQEIFPEYLAQDLEHHASYLQSWLTALRKDNQALFKAISQAQKAANFLMEKGGAMKLNCLNTVPTVSKELAMV
jgi:antirestriction protein ArdC